MTTSLRGLFAIAMLLALAPLGSARASTIQGITFDKPTNQGIGTTVFLFGCCHVDTVAPDFSYAFTNVAAGNYTVSANLPPGYEGGSAEYSVCTNATGACHTEASWVPSQFFIANITVPASGFVDVWWRFTPPGSTTTSTTTPTTTTTTSTLPVSLQDYVILGVNTLKTPVKAASVVLGDQGFVTEGSVGVNDYSAGLPAALKFGTSVFMPNGSAVVAQKCSTDFVTAPPPSDSSFWTVYGDPTLGNCPTAKFTRAADLSFTPPILTPPALPSFSPGAGDMTQNPLSPGAYGDLVVSGDVPFVLAGNGTYQFASIKVQSMKKLVVAAAAIIDVKGALTIGEFGNFGPMNNQVNPNDIQVNVGCGSDNSCSVITFDRASHIGMALYAPNAKLNLNRSVRFKGRIVANNVNGDQTVLLRSARAAVVGSSGQFTTLRQEEYGATTGRANGATGLVTQHPGVLPVTVGGPGIRSLTIPGQAALECFLPATGSDPAALCAAGSSQGNNNCASSGNPAFPKFMTIANTCGNVVDPLTACGSGDTQCSGGQGGGTLTGQTLAAKLNVALSDAGATQAGLGDFILPACLCTNSTAFSAAGFDCRVGRQIDNTAQQIQGAAAGLEDGMTTVDDLIAQADEALGSDCNRSGVCTATCGTAFAPPDPIRIGELAWALQSINECFSGTDGVGNAPAVIACPVGACSTTPPDACPF